MNHSIESIIGKNVLILGDFMVDKYIIGRVTRISPEAPVPVLNVEKISRRLGGAGNVANNVAALGGRTRVMTCLGDDENADWIKKMLAEIGCNTDLVFKNPDLKTICKTRVVAKNQQFIRIDEEEIKPIPEDFCQTISKREDEIFAGIDAVILSDYGKGCITPCVAQAVIRAAKRRAIPVVVDPKGKDYRKYTGATICTPNTAELSAVCGSPIETEQDVQAFGEQLKEDISLTHLLVTRSEKGLSLFKNGQKQKIDFPVVPKEVIDVTGAGDTVVAVIALGLGAGLDVEDCCRYANQAASISISKFGAATASVSEILALENISTGKIKELNHLKEICRQLNAQGKKVVFTNGCFDLLHAGHLVSLQTAKSFGDVLIVGLNSDRSVKSLKGYSRPIIDEQNRAKMLAGLECVDYLTIFDEDTPENLIQEICPDILVKGEDWEDKKIAGEDFVLAHGGKIEYIPLKPGFSTTNIIQKIKEQ
ncbi:D-glycero-beta-D-manno-heptose-7-phosphate kinase [Caproiciproducens galactitolivorans]|uniref:D-glycero-beta-D-manno-heptose-7-phosphate kinase n=1 Tax=Caproiciproducens galactitolivorans TaxID=642589 RepID=UPI00240A9615|nr:D-glycero-beta-D-manno-heptose-7-phosphate kinase [Caproiciproducens galactitolivorans]